MKYLLSLSIVAGLVIALYTTPLLEWSLLFLFLGIVPGTDTELSPIAMLWIYGIIAAFLIAWLIRELPKASHYKRELNAKKSARKSVRSYAKKRHASVRKTTSSKAKPARRATKRRLA